MGNDSRFLTGGKPDVGGAEDSGLTGLDTLSVSRTGAFRILSGKHFGRKVVIKTLKEDHRTDRVAYTQLRKEFALAFPLSSPNVVQTFRLMEFAGGIPAIELEWCDGSDLRSLLDCGVKPDDALLIVRGVLNGLADIHRAGIIHRDIKPENVIYDPFRKIVKIIDFGCAYATGELFLQGPNGTEDYTPQEKLKPGSEPEPKDDLYALGVLAAELTDAMLTESRSDAALKQRIETFASSLKERRFDTADKALSALESGPTPRRLWKKLIIPAAIIAAIALLLLILLPGRHSDSAPEARGGNADTPIPTDSTQSPSPPTEVDAHRIGDLSAPEGKTSGTQESYAATTSNEQEDAEIEPPMRSINPYSRTSDADAKAYDLAVGAGGLLRAAEAPDASLKTLSDAFVVKFCDSVYFTDKLGGKYSRSMDEIEKREAAKKCAAAYRNEMERKHNARFGPGVGNAHRRHVMLEGRFYCAFMTYHSHKK